MVNMRQRLLHIDALKCLLILIVVLGHALQSTHCGDGALANYIHTIQMPLFIYVSGFLAGYSKWTAETLLRKMQRLLVPFVTWGLVTALLGVKGFWGIFINPQDGLWFLWALAFDIAIFFFCVKGSRWLGVKADFLLVGLWLVLELIVARTGIRIFGIHQVAYYFLFFSGGYLAWRHIKFDEIRWRSCLLCLGCWILCGWFYLRKGQINLPFDIRISGVMADVYRMITASVGIMGIAGLIFKLRNCSLFRRRIVSFIGQMTLGIYAVHVLLVRIYNPLSFSVVLTFFYYTGVSIAVVVLLRKNKHLAFLFLGEGGGS